MCAYYMQCTVHLTHEMRAAERARLRAAVTIEARPTDRLTFSRFPGPRLVINYRFTATKIDSRALEQNFARIRDDWREFCLRQKLEIDVQFHVDVSRHVLSERVLNINVYSLNLMVIIKSIRKKNLNDIFGDLNLSAFKQSRMRLFFLQLKNKIKTRSYICK